MENKTVQEWLPFEKILNNGIIKLKNNEYIKITKITPINFNLKSELEQEAILNSYKIFLKTCNFNFQILIQSNKEDLSKHIKNYYIILKEKNTNKEILNFEDYAVENLNDKFFKIKDCLSRCGNLVISIDTKEEIISILFSFLNSRIYFNQI